MGRGSSRFIAVVVFNVAVVVDEVGVIAIVVGVVAVFVGVVAEFIGIVVDAVFVVVVASHARRTPGVGSIGGWLRRRGRGRSGRIRREDLGERRERRQMPAD